MIDLQSSCGSTSRRRPTCLQQPLPRATTATSSSTFGLASSLMGHQVVLAQPGLQLLLLGARYHRSWIAAAGHVDFRLFACWASLCWALLTNKGAAKRWAGLTAGVTRKRTMARADQSGPSDARLGRGGGEWL